MTRRRDLLIWGGALAAGIGFSTWIRTRPTPLSFTPLATPPGFRMLGNVTGGSTGGASGIGAALFAGLDAPAAKDQTAPPADPCRALFGAPDPGDTRLPIAVFSDYFCPYCAAHSRALEDLAAARDDIRLVLHEWPVLTPRSPELARLALAAREQGATWEAHHWLMTHALPPGPAGARRLAQALDLDPDTLLSDTQAPWVSDHIRQATALANLFGLSGTPGTVIGRTLVAGATDLALLDRLADLERAEPGVCG